MNEQHITQIIHWTGTILILLILVIISNQKIEAIGDLAVKVLSKIPLADIIKAWKGK